MPGRLAPSLAFEDLAPAKTSSTLCIYAVMPDSSLGGQAVIMFFLVLLRSNSLLQKLGLDSHDDPI